MYAVLTVYFNDIGRRRPDYVGLVTPAFAQCVNTLLSFQTERMGSLPFPPSRVRSVLWGIKRAIVFWSKYVCLSCCMRM